VASSYGVTFGVGGVELAVQSGQLGGEQFVVGGGGAHGEGLFAGDEHVGAQQRGADLVEDERVEGVGADVAFGAAPVAPPALIGSWLRQW
jgi:hypothetical protein